MGKHIAVLVAAILVGLGAYTARANAGVPRPATIARISKAVFGSRWRVAACIAHYESTDGAHLTNGVSYGPWQIDPYYHRWVNTRRLVYDWWYSARVAWIISNHGRDWHQWNTHADCGV